MRARGSVVIAALLAATLTACAPGPSGDGAPTTPGERPSAQTEVVASGLDAPWSIVFVGDTALVGERDSARILELDGDGNAREIAVIDGVVPRGEGGLLGLAVRERTLYAYFTASDGNRIERYELTGEPGALGFGSAETVLEGIPSAGTHNGGRLAFGPDGMLYATTGDAGDPSRAQDRDSLAGKILRLTPEGRVPSDNPFPGSPVFSYGHRNPQGIAWDEHGTMYAAEFGQNTWDELNIIEAGGNYGWPEAEGIADRGGFIDPVQQWSPGQASPSGIAVLDDTIFIANLRGQRLTEVPLSDLASSTVRFVGELGRLRDAVVAPDGSLWILTNNTDGRGNPGPDDDRILRFDPRS